MLHTQYINKAVPALSVKRIDGVLFKNSPKIKSGSFLLNNVKIKLNSSDSLKSIISKINEKRDVTGVKAIKVKVNDNDYKLVLLSCNRIVTIIDHDRVLSQLYKTKALGINDNCAIQVKRNRINGNSNNVILKYSTDREYKNTANILLIRRSVDLIDDNSKSYLASYDQDSNSTEYYSAVSTEDFYAIDLNDIFLESDEDTNSEFVVNPNQDFIIDPMPIPSEDSGALFAQDANTFNQLEYISSDSETENIDTNVLPPAPTSPKKAFKSSEFIKMRNFLKGMPKAKERMKAYGFSFNEISNLNYIDIKKTVLQDQIFSRLSRNDSNTKIQNKIVQLYNELHPKDQKKIDMPNKLFTKWKDVAVVTGNDKMINFYKFVYKYLPMDSKDSDLTKYVDYINQCKIRNWKLSSSIVAEQ